MVLTTSWTAALPGDTLTLQMPATLVMSLPEGAAYSKKAGRTRLTLSREGDDVVARAETDSTPMGMTHYERRARDTLAAEAMQASHQATRQASQTATRHPADSPWAVLLLLPAALAGWAAWRARHINKNTV